MSSCRDYRNKELEVVRVLADPDCRLMASRGSGFIESLLE